MAVIVQTHGSLRDHIGTGIDLDNVQIVGDVIARLSIPDDTGLAILVNGRLAHWQTPLHNGDVVQLIPQISGG